MIEPGEPEWLPEDRDIAVVWADEQSQKCSRCGTWLWQENMFEADHYTCPGCRLLDVHERTIQNSPGSHDGVRLALYRRTDGD